MTPAQQQVLFENTARAMGDARQHIKERHVRNCWRADPAYGAGIARALGFKIEDIVSQQQPLVAK
jgi:catalase